MNEITVTVISLLLAAFFSGIETAFITSNRLRIELERKQGAFGSEILRLFTASPEKFTSAMLTGFMISLVTFAISFSLLISSLLANHIQSELVIILIDIILSSAIILVAGELLPGSFFIITPTFLLRYLSIPALFFYSLLYPVAGAIGAASDFISNLLFGEKVSDTVSDDPLFRRTDLDNFLASAQQNPDSGSEMHNIKIFRNALDFSSIRIRECMIPRTEIDAVEVTATIPEIKEKFIETGHSRILVYNNSIDNVSGYFELKDLFTNPTDVLSRLRKVAVVPETMAASKLLKIFVEEKKSVAIVVDEFGGTSGMVTIEDLLEEIVGDIEDEHDVSGLTEKRISDREFILSARHEIDYLNETYNLSLPESDEYKTLAGMILYHHGSIPAPNDIIKINNIIIRVLRVSPTRLELVNLRIA